MPTKGERTGARIQPGVVVGVIALVAALAGTATALPGRNTVKTDDIKRNSVKAKQIKDGQVGPAEIADGSVGSGEIADGGVGSGEIADGSVGAAEFAPSEPFHAVGAPGEPQFFNGGEGDCVWKPGLPGVEGTPPPSFAKDVHGTVRLRGNAQVTDGAGGDGQCDATMPGESEDGLAFTLPAGYTPAYLELSGLPAGTIVAPDAGAFAGVYSIPGGGVFGAVAGQLLLDGVEFTPAASAQPASARAHISAGALRRLGVR